MTEVVTRPGAAPAAAGNAAGMRRLVGAVGVRSTRWSERAWRWRMTEVVTRPGAAPAAAGIAAELERLCATVVEPLLRMAATVAGALPADRRPRLADLDPVRSPALAQLRRS